MKKAFLGAAFFALLAGPSLAADIAKPVHKAAPVVAPVYNWTGFYAGVNAGWAGIDGDASTQFSQLFLSTLNQRADLDRSSFVGGAHVGYNWAFAHNWVAGIEADFSWMNNSASGTAPNVFSLTGQVLPGGFHWNRDVDWLASVRGRIGFLITPPLLLYFTGGFAWSGIDYGATLTTGNGTWASAFSETKNGYVLGGGLEWMLAGNWLLRGEYLHYRFDGASIITTNPLLVGFGPQFNAPFVWDDTTINVVRIGLSYKFDDWGKGPVVARY